MSESVLSGHIPEKQLAAELKVAPATLRKWRRLGEAPAHTKIGKRVEYSRAAVARWLKEREHTVAA